MSEKDIWKEISIKFNLQAMEIDKYLNWNFGDFIFSSKWDIMSIFTKLRKAGYNFSEDSEEMFLKLLSIFKEKSIHALLIMKNTILTFDVNETLLNLDGLKIKFKKYFNDENLLSEWFGSVINSAFLCTIVNHK